MGISVFPTPSATVPKKNVVTLTSGTSWTVPTGVTSVIATLIGGGGGGGRVVNSGAYSMSQPGLGGQIRTTTVTTTPGASISYAIAAGGDGGTNVALTGGTGGTTTFTGATSATGGIGGGSNSGSNIAAGTAGLAAGNGGGAATATTTGTSNGGAGGAGMIQLEYWV